MSIRILHGDCRDVLKTLPSASVHCVVTSPPYWGLRDYGVAGQLGMEQSLGEYIDVMVAVFREVRRVLRDDGTLWLNLGDSYAASPNGRSAADVKALGNDDRTFRDKPFSTIGRIFRPGSDRADGEVKLVGHRNRDGLAGFDAGYLKPKDLCGIPWRVAFALQVDGWYLRQDIIWAKPNPMPESVTDRCTKAHEYIFLLSKSARYFYDAEAIKEEAEYGRRTRPDAVPRSDRKAQSSSMWRGVGSATEPVERNSNQGNSTYEPEAGRNKRSVWEVATAPFSEAHFATFPPALIEPCILAGCPEKACTKCGAPWVRLIEKGDTDKIATRGLQPWTAVTGQQDGRGGLPIRARIELGFSTSCSCNAGTVPGAVLDPFGGAGTTGLVADRLGRSAILIELNPEYAAMAERRITDDAPLFAQVAAE